MKRVILAALLIISVAVIIIGNFSWNQKVEKTVKEAEERISAPANKIADFNNEQEKDSISENNNSEETIKEETTVATASDFDQKPTLQDIKAEYQSLFEELEIQETSKIDQLIVEAKADYVSGKALVGDLVVKYEQISQLMQENADIIFNALYENLQHDLEANGYSIDEAEKFKQHYDKVKQERISRVVNQIQEF